MIQAFSGNDTRDGMPIMTFTNAFRFIFVSNSLFIAAGTFFVCFAAYLTIGKNKSINENGTRKMPKFRKYYTPLFSMKDFRDPMIAYSDDLIQFANDAAVKLFRCGSEEALVGRKVTELIAPKYVSVYREQVDNVKNNMHSKPRTGFDLMRLDGTIFYAEVFSAISNDKPLQICSFIFERETAQDSERTMMLEKNRYDNIIEATNTATWELDVKSGKISVNQKWLDMLGYSREETSDYNIRKWEKLVHPDDLVSSKKKIDLHLCGKEPFYNSELRMRHKDGHYVWISDKGKTIIFDAEGKPETMYGINQDITARKEKEMEIEHLSYCDILTGIYNRRKFEEVLREKDTEENLPISIVMADVDALKTTNDAFGHLQGDNLLKKVANVIKSTFNFTDLIFRVGGDEFVILITNCDCEKTRKAAEEVKDALMKDSIGGLPCSVSFGIAAKKNPQESIFEVYKDAEMLMYNQKLINSSEYHMNVIELIRENLFNEYPQEESHARMVTEFATKLAKECGLSETEVAAIGTLAEVHDIGKIAIGHELLKKNGKLEETEIIRIRQHPEIGYRILFSAVGYNRIALDVLSHHERWDGHGYPKGLKEEAIPFRSRIIAICEAYSAMIQDWPYRKALGKEVARREILEGAGKQFDPELARIFVEKVINQ